MSHYRRIRRRKRYESRLWHWVDRARGTVMNLLWYDRLGRAYELLGYWPVTRDTFSGKTG